MFEGLKLTPDLPPVWLLVFATLTWVLATYLPLVVFDVAPLGRLVILIGLALIGWSAIWFWRKKTPIEPGHQPKALIIEGPYRLTRNPIYVGLALILLGYALGQGGLSGLVPVFAFPIVIHRRFVLPEEAMLRAAFPTEAEAYIARTRRWLI